MPFPVYLVTFILFELRKAFLEMLTDGFRFLKSVTVQLLENFFMNDTNFSSLFLVLLLFHRLNMEIELQSLFGLLCTAVLIG